MNTATTNKPDYHQQGVIRWLTLLTIPVTSIRHDLLNRDRYGTPVFDNPYLSTKDLNHTFVRNARKSLRSHQTNPSGRSRWQPLPALICSHSLNALHLRTLSALALVSIVAAVWIFVGLGELSLSFFTNFNLLHTTLTYYKSTTL